MAKRFQKVLPGLLGGLLFLCEARAGELMLTGLVEFGDERRAFFQLLPEGQLFSMRVGESRDQIKVISLNARETWVRVEIGQQESLLRLIGRAVLSTSGVQQIEVTLPAPPNRPSSREASTGISPLAEAPNSEEPLEDKAPAAGSLQGTGEDLSRLRELLRRAPDPASRQRIRAEIAGYHSPAIEASEARADPSATVEPPP